MASKSTSNLTMQEKVHRELRRSLMVGAFIPGQPISLRKLAESLKTSLMPVREAVNRLIAERAFEMLPNRTVIVPSLDEEKLRELMRWRGILESEAAEQACLNITATTLKKIEKIDTELLEAVRKHELQQILTKNQEFHFEIYEASKNTLLLPMIESLWLQGGPFIYYSLRAPQIIWNGEFHAHAIEAIKNKDPKALKKAVANDIGAMADFLLSSHLFRRPEPRPIA